MITAHNQRSLHDSAVIWSFTRVHKNPFKFIKIDLIKYKKDAKDTRVKHIYLNEKGKKIFEEIFSKQKKRIYSALLNSSAKEVVDFNNVLKKLIKSDERI